ncbi:MAG TPA: glycosyltransferase family 1 protein [Chloroflexota bacterium]|nr:glycosyltransferase family 1 protein [Chloroflexota bacterium]
MALDLTRLDQRTAAIDPHRLEIRLAQALSQHAPEVEFIVLARRAAGTAVAAALDAPNVRRITVAEPGPTELLLARVDAHLPGHTRRARLARRLDWPRTLRRPVARWRPSLLRQLRVDLVLCPFTAPGITDPAIPLVAAVADMQHLSHPHLLTSAERAIRARGFDGISRYADRILCTANSVRDAVVQSDGVRAGRVVTVPPTRLLSQLTQPPPSPAGVADALGRFRLRERQYFLVSVPGVIEPRHNLHLLLVALGILRARAPRLGVRVVCIGDATWPQGDLHTAAERMGLADMVQFRGLVNRQDLSALILGSQAVIVPSLYETIGDGALDAMALGRAVLCSDLSSLVDLSGDSALLFDPHRPADLAGAIERAASQPRLLDDLARRGQARLEAFDAAPTVARTYLDAIRETRAPCLASR